MSELSVPWWEGEELLSHLNSRSDIWVQDEENPALWIRLSTMAERDPCLALQIVPSDGENKWRRAYLQCTPLGWSEERCDEYIQTLLRNKTSYGIRLETEYVLQTELGIEVERAGRAAIILAFIHLVGAVVEEVRLGKPGTEVSDASDVNQPNEFFGQFGDRGYTKAHVRLYTGGPTGLFRGLVSLVTMTDGGAHVIELTGMLRPRGTDIEQMKAYLFEPGPMNMNPFVSRTLPSAPDKVGSLSSEVPQ